MAFSMSQIKRRNRTSGSVNIKECFSLISKLGILTDNVKYGLTIYLKKRVKTRGVTNLSYDEFYQMVQRLLSYCCGKPFIKISQADVQLNECEILFHIKFATQKSFLKELYATQEDIDKWTQYDKKQPVKINQSVEINQALLDEYFGDVVVI